MSLSLLHSEPVLNVTKVHKREINCEKIKYKTSCISGVYYLRMLLRGALRALGADTALMSEQDIPSYNS